MKRFLTLALATSLIVGTLAPRKSEAAIAIAGGLGAVTPLAAMAPFLIPGSLFGIATLWSGLRDRSGYNKYTKDTLVLGVFTALHALGAVIVLDKEDQSQLGFAPLTQEKADELGLTSSHIKSFNRARSMVNQTGKQIGKSCASQFSTDAEVHENDVQEIINCVDKGWNDYHRANPKIINKKVLDTIIALRS